MQNKQYTTPNDRLCSQSQSSDCGTGSFCVTHKMFKLMEEGLSPGTAEVLPPSPTPICKLSMTSMV